MNAKCGYRHKVLAGIRKLSYLFGRHTVIVKEITLGLKRMSLVLDFKWPFGPQLCPYRVWAEQGAHLPRKAYSPGEMWPREIFARETPGGQSHGSQKTMDWGESPRECDHGLFRNCPLSLEREISQCLPSRITELPQSSVLLLSEWAHLSCFPGPFATITWWAASSSSKFWSRPKVEPILLHPEILPWA